MQKISLTDIEPATWSGGQTWQHLIQPSDGCYPPKPGHTFDLRISTATVQAETSTFTALPGIDRWLYVDQPIELIHNGKKQTLQPQELFIFKGEDQVISYGQTRDLNVMWRRDCGPAPKVQLSQAEISGPGFAVDILTRDLYILEAGETVALDNALLIKLEN